MGGNRVTGKLAVVGGASGVPDRAPTRRQRGFTLIEISIAVIALGLVVGCSIIAQDMLQMAKVKGLANDFTTVKAAINAYQDAFRALPGDDPNVSTHVPGAVSLAGPGVGNGLIDGMWNSTSPMDESLVFWQHVRLANLVSGATDLGTPGFGPRNHVDGIFGVSSATPSQLQISGMRGTFQACSSKIPGKIANRLILQLGHGSSDSAETRAVPDDSPPGAPAASVAMLDDGAAYTVCHVF